MADESHLARSFEVAAGGVFSPETTRIAEPVYPLLSMDELGAETLTGPQQLSETDRHALRPEEIAVHVHRAELRLPPRPITPLEIVMKATRAKIPEEIGFMGPSVASVDISGNPEKSRYERQHGRDDLIAGNDVKAVYPQLLDTVVTSLASTQGLEHETFVPGQPYGFEKPGAIILVNFSPDDPLGIKFRDRKDWKPRFYGSADAPGLFVDAIAHLQTLDPSYIFSRTYTALDGKEYPISRAFELSVGWLLDRMAANPEGVVEYRNPYDNGKGMRNQGWKDSADAMVHKNGEWVNSKGGVAPIEIQCQTVVSLRKAAAVYHSAFGNPDMAASLEAAASQLHNFVLSHGWIQDERGGYFATGWDRDEAGRLRRIESRSIDMHSILPLLDMQDPSQKAMAQEVIRTLTSEEMFTRWGSRVMSAREVAYGHLRYHCGVWPDKSNRVAESIAAAGYYGIDREMGKHTTELITILGCVPEHISGEDSPAPVLPTKDLYVYNTRYKELHLAEQVPPLGQTWGATSELGKSHRYASQPLQAASVEDQAFEDEIIGNLRGRYSDQ